METLLGTIVGDSVHVLICLAVLSAGCSGSSTSEDARRAEVLDRDPLLTADLDGVRWETSSVAGPGSGPGPGTYWTEAFRWGRVEGDPREALLEAGEAAGRFGWKITDARCHPGFGYGMDGWKQFDRSVALLSMSWMDYPGEDRDRIYIKAQTPPVNAGSPTNALPLHSREVDLATTCLAQADGDEDDASPRRSTVPAELLRLRRDRGGADR